MPLKNLDTTRSIYQFIREYIQQEQIPPSHKEISEACFISSGTVTRHLDRLEMFGLIDRKPGAVRSIRLIDDKRAEGRLESA